MAPMRAAATNAAGDMDPREYQRRIWAWTMYDWANSAFITTVIGVILPVYYSRVAGATLPGATATAYWGVTLSLSLFVIAILSPILGTVSDAIRGKKRLLALFIAQGVFGTALLVLVERGDWLLASIALIIARVGFGSANVFYDALLPHVAREEDRDKVSARGYALGYLGGGLLLAANIAMTRVLPGTWGARLSFLSVAIWWAVFSVPILTRVPEPPASGVALSPGTNVVAATFGHLWGRLKDIRRYRELMKMLIAFLLYNDGIGTIIGLGVIYGAELGFDDFQLVLALLLMQFGGIPFALMFGRLPDKEEKRRPFFLAFILFNLIVLPVTGLAGARLLPAPPESIPLSLGLLLGLQAAGLLFAWLAGPVWFAGLAGKLDTQRSILLSLIIFMVIAAWGFAIRSAFEFWFLAWMIAVVLGGSQALSRSLYASMSPTSKSGEFFGLFSIMEKFSAMLGPLMFAGAVALFGSSRPGILSLIVLFIAGATLLMRVNVAEGQRVARLEDAGIIPAGS